MKSVVKDKVGNGGESILLCQTQLAFGEASAPMIVFLSLPSPLHTTVVNFPIVLLLLGAVVAVAAAITPQWRLPLLTAVLLSSGAVGSAVIGQTGEAAGALVNESQAVAQILEQRADWAEHTQTAAILVAFLALGAVASTRWPKAARSLNIVTAVGAMITTWCVFEFGQHGGQLVYRRGAGINEVTTDAEAPPRAALPLKTLKSRKALER